MTSSRATRGPRSRWRSTSTADHDRRLLRRAALRLALLKGDVLAAARAWDRLRVSGAAVRPEEAEAARAARAAVGHALRDARWRRLHDDDRFGFHVTPEMPPPPRPSLLRRSRPGIGALAALGLVALVVLLSQPSAPGGAPALDAQATAAPTGVSAAGRGRTSATLAPVVRAPATPLPTPATPAPVAVASAAPGAGTGRGIGAGVLPPLPDTDDRFIFVVLDAQTTRPIAGVCVAYGTECRPDRRTTAQGLWWIDFPRSSALADRWRFDFVLDGYVPESREIRYVPGEVNPPVAIMLRRAR